MMQAEAIAKVQELQDQYIQQDLPKPIAVEFNTTQLSPLNPDIFMLATTQQYTITHPSVIELYVNSKLTNWCLHPFCTSLSEKIYLKIMFQDIGLPNLKQFADEQRGPNAERWLRHWIVELAFLGLLQINKIANVDEILLNPQIIENWVFPQLSLTNIFVKSFWGKKACIIDQSQFQIENPLVIRLTGAVGNLNEYLKNLSKILDSLIFFDQLIVKEFQSLRDLEKFYHHEIKNHENKQMTTKFMQSLIKYNASKEKPHKQQNNGSLSADEYRWIQLSVGLSKSIQAVLICKCSQNDYSPASLWNHITEQKKGIQKGKCLLVMTIRPQKGKDTVSRLAFYSPQFPNRETCLKNPTGFYQKDPKKQSFLLNLSRNTVHSLEDEEYAFGYNPNLLMTIGKCDIVLSAYNVTNLCYFPVSYEIDGEGLCQTDEKLCGGRNFHILEVELYKFRKT